MIGKAILVTKSKRASSTAFCTGPTGVKATVQDHYDLILEINLLRSQLKRQLMPQWSQGYNEEVRDTDFEEPDPLLQTSLQSLSHLTPTVLSRLHDHTPYTHIITTIHHNQIVTEKLPQIIKKEQH